MTPTPAPTPTPEASLVVLGSELEHFQTLLDRMAHTLDLYRAELKAIREQVEQVEVTK